MTDSGDAQHHETATGPLNHSFSQLARRLARYDLVDLDEEDVILLVEIILSDHAYRDVSVEGHDEHGPFVFSIGSRGVVIPYPFTTDELFELVEELLDMADATDDPAPWDEASD